MPIVPFQKPESGRIRHPYSGFEYIPHHLTRFELLNYFSFTEKDQTLIFKARGSDNQIGLALLLGGMRLTGRFIQDFRLLPMKVLNHVCEQLDIQKPSPWQPPKRRTSRHHAEYIRKHLDLRRFQASDRIWVEQQIEAAIAQGTPAHKLLEAVEMGLREQKVVLPGVTVLSKIMAQARLRAEEKIYDRIYQRLDRPSRDKLSELFMVRYIAELVRDKPLRHTVQLALNKGEALHSLDDRLFFGGQGEIRNRGYHEQVNTASCLNFLVAALVVCNTIHMQACLRKLRADGVTVQDEDLKYLSPIIHRHIALYGHYTFDLKHLEETPPPENLSY